MKEIFLETNVWPLWTEEKNEEIDNCFVKELKKSDQLEIAVGFSSCESLRELDKLIAEQNIKNVCVILGMYFFIGFPDSLLKLALSINNKWQKLGIGEIRVTYSFKYHGKLYCFRKDNKIHSVIIGSPNLSFLVANELTKLTRQQYEIALYSNNSKTLKKSQNHINFLKSADVSKNIDFLEKQQLLINTKKVKIKDQKDTSKMKWEN